jgi:uncharacterized caspase-like protein
LTVLHAVVVGINAYRDSDIRNLTCARADAEAVAVLLERVHPAERRVRLILDEEATREALMVAIGEDLPRVVNEDDVVLLYFAGHGAPETESAPDRISRYLVTHDTRHSNVFATGLDMERDLPRLFERLSSPRLVLLVIDACFSGLAGGRTFEGPRLRQLRGQYRDLDPISLKDMDLGEGRLMIGACGDTELAREDPAVGHGVLTHYLLKGPTGLPGGDHRTVSVHALYESIAHDVRDHTRGRQTPVINGRATIPRIPFLW